MKRLYLLLLTLLPALAPASETWTNRAEVADRQALASLSCDWPEQGTKLQLVATNHASLEFRLKPGRTPEVHLSSGRHFTENYEDLIRVWPVPALATNIATLTLRRQSQAWMLYVDGEPVARFPEPWPGALTIRQPVSALPPAGASDPDVQRTAAFRLDDIFPVTNPQPRAATWERAGSAWRLQGLVLAGESSYHHDRLHAAVQQNSGTNGLVFLVTDSGACHGFTAFTDPATAHLVFQLWQGSIVSHAPRQILSTIATELLAEQWTRMEVQIFDDRVVCLANDIEILRQRLPLPPGGRFGLIAETAHATRFDAVSIASHEDYLFESADELQFQTLLRHGNFRSLAGETLSPAGGSGAALALESPGDREARAWIFGATDDGPHQLETCLRPGPEDFACSLIAGWQGPARPYYQFTCRQQGDRRTFALDMVTSNSVTLLDTVSSASTGEPLRLTLDARRPHELRGLVNGRLVVIDRPAAPMTGAGGLRLEGRKRLQFSLPKYVGVSPADIETFEKNPTPSPDPRLRHWAAPEAQWRTMRDGLTWLRGDIITRAKLRLPVVERSVLHLAVPEDATLGQCTVAISNGLLTVHTPATGARAACTVKIADIPEKQVENAGSLRFYTVNFEDDLLWISSDVAMLGRCHLPPLARARRTRLEGFTPELLRQTQVRRENVFDTFGSEALPNWTRNGGDWKVVTCCPGDPTWTHVKVESTNAFAGLWSNFEMSGDFCVEFDAGMCSQADRPGDLNLTVHSRRNTPCDGYAITLAGWDPDLSRLYTRLFRNGEVATTSTIDLAPDLHDERPRDGQEPRITSSSLAAQAAWHNLRFRRVGNQLSYLYDQEPVLSWRDPAPLDAGTLGIWTYCNSMKIGRVRIAAESIKPRAFRFWSITNTPAVHVPAPVAAAPGLRINSRPAELLDPALWQAADPVSRPWVRFDYDRKGKPAMRITAQQGSGSFLVAPQLAPIPATRLMGWHFEIARHPEARLNFEFSAGRTHAHSPDLLPESCHRFSYVINGSDDPRGARCLTGRLTEPPAASRPDARLDDSIWTPVNVWLPTEATGSNFSIRIDGFGNLQHSDVQQGLAGNPPGAWYAIRNFHEIYRGVPTLDGPGDLRAAFDTMIGAQPPATQLQEWHVPAAWDPREPTVAWIAHPDTDIGLEAVMDAVIPEAVRVSSTYPWPSSLLPARRAQLDGQAAVGWQDGNDYVVLLPRSPEPQPQSSTTLQLELADGRSFQQRVPLITTNQPPVLLSCEMPAGGIQTFESRLPLPQGQGRARATLACADPQQGAHLRVQNAGIPETRLDSGLLARYDPEVTPVLQFRYKADPMAHVSITAGRYQIAFSESTGTLLAPGATGILDHAWHTWIGSPLMAARSGLLRDGFVIGSAELRVSAREDPDPTGRYSAVDLDDIASGPVVGPKHPLTFRLNYSDRQSVAQVLYTIAPGPAPWANRTGSGQDELPWTTVTNQQVVVPDLSTLPEGLHHLCTRAYGSSGTASAVYDIPFLLARHPPAVSYTIKSVPDRYNGTCLELAIAGRHAPPLLRNLRLSLDGTPLDLTTDNGQFSYTATAAQLEIDWPWLLRKSLRNAKDGDVLTLLLDGITDAAGNEAPPQQIPLKVDFANDKQPPAVLPLQHTTNLLVYTPQFRSPQDFFTSMPQVMAQEPQTENGCQFVPFHCDGGDHAGLWRNFVDQPWDPEAFPWLAISVRIAGGFAAGTAPFDLQLRPAENLPDVAVKPALGAAYLWSLPGIDNQPFVLGHLDWKPGQWVDLLINVRDLLRDQTKLPRACTLREIALIFPPRAKFTLQVRGMAILAPWGPADVLKFNAYDINGIAGLVWQNGGHSAKTGLRPACLTLPPEDAQWLKVRVSDRPGNLTPVFMVPLPPHTVPMPDNLPPDVEEEDF